MTGETWTPVPQTKISSATYSSERSIERSAVGMPSFSMSSMSALRVTPSSRSSLTGGVSATPSRTTKTLAADDSLTCPPAVSTTASSKPLSSASDFWNAMFT